MPVRPLKDKDRHLVARKLVEGSKVMKIAETKPMSIVFLLVQESFDEVSIWRLLSRFTMGWQAPRGDSGALQMKKLRSKISMACSSKYIYIYTNSSQTSERYLRDATWCHLMLDVFASEKWWLQSVAVGRRQYLGPLLLSMAWVVRSLKERCPFSMSDFLPFERCWMLVWVFMMAHGWPFAQLIRCLICTLMAFCWIYISISFISFYI